MQQYAAIRPTTAHSYHMYQVQQYIKCLLLADIDDRDSPPPRKNSNSSCNLPQHKWSHLVDPMEVRLGVRPFLYLVRQYHTLEAAESFFTNKFHGGTHTRNSCVSLPKMNGVQH